MSSTLFQIRLDGRELKIFRSPEAQPPFNPKNCGAVSGQLLGLVTPKVANEMTIMNQGALLEEWSIYISKTLEQQVTPHEQDLSFFESFCMSQLFPGFGTIVLTIPNERRGHYFVVAKSEDNRLVILDPQLRMGFFNINQYFSRMPSHKKFIVFIRNVPRTAKQHETDYLSFLAEAIRKCNISSGEVYMDIDKPPTDVVMEGTSRRKRRKTKRRSLAKRTLRRMNRRRRIL